MYVRIECPSVGGDSWDRFANILIKNSDTNQWYEMARHITPYGVGNSQLDRGLEVDVTDFKSMLEGNVELKIFVETWEQGTGWVISVEFDFLDGTPDYEFYQISPVIQFNNNSLGGVPYGGEKKKIIGVDKDNEPKRNNLKPFRRYLDLVNPEHICFVSGKKIDEGDLSIDHIIPWSYMYSDDLWNLVYVNKSINSSMSNRIKKDEIKNKLIKRNKTLLQMLDEKNVSNREVEKLRLAIDKDYVELFWIGHQLSLIHI